MNTNKVKGFSGVVYLQQMRVFALLLFAALTALGADVAGKWKATFESQNGTREVTFTFQVSDGKLTGTATGQQGDAPVVGKVEGDKINFTVERDQFKATFTGTIDGDEIKLSGTIGERTFDFPLKRVKE
jgi:hypothetical protein